MKKLGLLFYFVLMSALSVLAQGARNIVINEVMTQNTTNLTDEYNEHRAWIELANTSYSSYNVRGMFITTNRKVLDKNLTPVQRISMMSTIPDEEELTYLKARQHSVFFLNSSPTKGGQHLSAQAFPDQPVWIALYDANGTDLIDSVSVPPLAANSSFARIHDGADKWVAKAPAAVTPGTDNFIQVTESKVTRWKNSDPHGYAMSVLSMGIVFSCLALLYVFFSLLGSYMEHKQRLKAATESHASLMAILKAGKKMADTGHKTNVILKDGLKTKGIDKEIYIAAISLALQEYLEDQHDMESDVITIKPKHSNWNNLNR